MPIKSRTIIATSAYPNEMQDWELCWPSYKNLKGGWVKRYVFFSKQDLTFDDNVSFQLRQVYKYHDHFDGSFLES